MLVVHVVMPVHHGVCSHLWSTAALGIVSLFMGAT